MMNELMKRGAREIGRWTMRQLSAIFSLERRAIPTGAETVTVKPMRGASDAGAETLMLAALCGPVAAPAPAPMVKAKPARAARKAKAHKEDPAALHARIHRQVAFAHVPEMTVKGYRG